MIKLHTNYFIVIVKCHTYNTHSATTCSTYVSFFESYTFTIFCNKEYLCISICLLNFDKLIIITKVDTYDTCLSNMSIFHNRCLLNDTLLSYDENILILIIFLNRDNALEELYKYKSDYEKPKGRLRGASIAQLGGYFAVALILAATVLGVLDYQWQDARLYYIVPLAWLALIVIYVLATIRR